MTPQYLNIHHGYFELWSGNGTFSATLTGANYAKLNDLRLNLTPYDLRPMDHYENDVPSNEFDRVAIGRLFRQILTRFPAKIVKLLRNRDNCVIAEQH